MVGDPCIARYESDQVRCAECRLVWDRNDPDPPECGRKRLEANKPYLDVMAKDIAALPLKVVRSPSVAPSLAEYASDRVFDGKRPLTKAEVLDRYWKWRGAPAVS